MEKNYEEEDKTLKGVHFDAGPMCYTDDENIVDQSQEALEAQQLQIIANNSPETLKMVAWQQGVNQKLYEEEAKFSDLIEGIHYVFLSSGGTLTAIAKDNNLTIENIKRLNPTAAENADHLPIGMRVLIAPFTKEEEKTKEEIEKEKISAIDKKITIIFMSGLSMSGSDSTGSGSLESSRSSDSGSNSSHHSGSGSSGGFENDYEEAIRSAVGENDNIKIRSYKSSWFDDSTKIAVTDFIEENKSDGSKLIIVGYSWGGDTALELANDFNQQEEIQIVDLMITIDPADGGFKTNSTVPDNVQTVMNYYQPNIQPGSLSGNTMLTKEKGNEVTKGGNILIEKTSTGEEATHSNIYDDVMDNVTGDIKKYLLSL